MVDGFGRHHARQIRPIHFAKVPRSLNQNLRIRFFGRNHAAHHAMGTQMPHQGSRVDFSQHRDCVPLHVLVRHLLRAPVRTDDRELADDQPFDKRLSRLIIRVVGAVIADLGICENDDLPGIGRIGSDFLVTGKRGIKNYFTLAFAWGPMAVAAEDAPVFERKNCLHCRSDEWIQSILAAFPFSRGLRRGGGLWNNRML